MEINIYKILDELELLKSQGYIFRGQPSSDFLLIPNAFRSNSIATFSSYFPDNQQWRYCDSLRGVVNLWVPEVSIESTWVHRIFELTVYIMQYNYLLAKYVQEHLKDFDNRTLNMYKLRNLYFWTTEKTFIYLFEYGLQSSIGRIGADGEIIQYSTINEEIAGYDDSLPQHYGVSTAAFDWTRNPYIAIYFALQNIPNEAKYFSIYAYKEISFSPINPFSIEYGNEDCNNPRIKAQEGLFLRFKYPCLFYFFHGSWPSMKTYESLRKGNFELLSYNIPISEKKSLLEILNKKQITKERLKLADA